MAGKGDVLTGARALFSINGSDVGYARGVTIGETIEFEELVVLNNIEIQEFVPTGYRVNFSASMFRLIGSTVKSRGWFPPVGQNAAAHLNNILETVNMEAKLEDTKSGRIFALVQQVKVQSHNFTVDARGIIGTEVEFSAIRVKDEFDLEGDNA